MLITNKDNEKDSLKKVKKRTYRTGKSEIHEAGDSVVVHGNNFPIVDLQKFNTDE